MRILFVSYRRAETDQQIGVLKRCLRLIASLDPRHEFFVLNFGPLFENDPLQRSLESRVVFLKEPPVTEFKSFFLEIAPHAVVLGESPVRGSMRKAYRAAASLGIPQFAIENYHGRILSRLIQLNYLHIRRWLMLGDKPLSPVATWGRDVVPPLTPSIAAACSSAREGITVIGYEDDSLAMAWRILDRLPTAQRVRIFVPKECVPKTLARHDYTLRSNPTDDELFSAIAQSKLVIGKGGFQQIAESLWLRTPVVAKKKTEGGSHLLFMPPSTRSQFRLVDSERDELRVMPWIEEMLTRTQSSQDTWGRPAGLEIAASRLETMLNAC